MPSLVLSVDTIVDIPNHPDRAEVKKVVNSLGHDITEKFITFCASSMLDIDSQSSIRDAVDQFSLAYKGDYSVLP